MTRFHLLRGCLAILVSFSAATAFAEGFSKEFLVENSEQLADALCEIYPYNSLSRFQNTSRPSGKAWDASRHAIIKLKPATTYTLDSRYTVRCNLTIQPSEPCSPEERPVIMLGSRAIHRTEHDRTAYYSPDAIINVCAYNDGMLEYYLPESYSGAPDKAPKDAYSSTMQRSSVSFTDTPKVSLVVKDIMLRTADNSVVHGDAATTVFEARRGKGIVFSNCDFRVQNGTMTLIDLRSCEDVSVTGCVLVNRNHKELTKEDNLEEGGNLWLRYGASNVEVSNNIMVKDGNDEILGFFNPPPSRGVISESDSDLDWSWKDIRVSNNIFTFEKSPLNSVSNIFIAFLGAYERDSYMLTQAFENIDFSHNTLNIQGPCLRIIRFQGLVTDNNSNISFSDNMVKQGDAFNDRCTFGSTVWVRMKNHDNPVGSHPKETILDFANNVFETSCRVTNNFQLLEVQNQDGVTLGLNFNNNMVNMRGVKITKGQGPAVMRLYSGDCRLEMSGNSCSGSHFLIATDNKVEIPALDCHVSRNVFTGKIMSYFPKVDLVNFTFNNNVCHDTGYDILFQQYGWNRESTATVIGNTFTKAPDAPQGGGLCFTYDTGGKIPELKSITVTGNIFTGYPASPLGSGWKARHQTVQGNTFYK